MPHRRRRIPLLLLAAALSAGAGARPQEPQTPADPAPILGAPPAFDLEAPREYVLLPADTALHQEPAARSPVLMRLDFAAELPVVERRGGWVRVLSGGFAGWATLDPEAAAEAALRIIPGGPDPQAVERARRHLPAGVRAQKLGPYALYTDLADGLPLAELSRLAAELPRYFHRRFGLAAAPGDGEVVVLYAREASYHAYTRGEADPTLRDSAGRALRGLAVLYAGGRPAGELRSVLVHELTHLVAYRALGTDLPPWLAEGLAEELAFCRVSRSGELLLGSLDTWTTSRRVPAAGPANRVSMAVETRTAGPRVALDELRREWSGPRRPELADLLVFSEVEFMAPDRRSLHYAMSGFWVRYLLDEHPDAFRSFLAAAARGEAVDAIRLRDRLGASPSLRTAPRSEGMGRKAPPQAGVFGALGATWEELEAAWGKWLRGKGPRKGER